MNEVAKANALRVGLLLTILEGWTPLTTVTARFGEVAKVDVMWLEGRGYVELAEDRRSARWRAPIAFEDLWRELIPSRPCPVRMREVGSHALG